MQPEFHSGAVTRPLSAILQLAMMGCPALRARGELAAGAGAVSADDTDLILQSDQSVACVNSRLAWSFEWAWMIYAVSVGYRRNTYNTTVQVYAQVHCTGRITYCIRYSCVQCGAAGSPCTCARLRYMHAHEP